MQNLLQQALAFQQSGRLDEADQWCAAILQVEPQNIDGLYLRGVVAHDRGQYELAVECFRAAIALAPDNAVYRHHLGISHHALGQTHEALACYREALWLQPNLAEAYCNLASLFLGMGQYADAVMNAQQALNYRPLFPEALVNLGSALASLGRHHVAEDYFREAIRLDSRLTTAHLNLGNVLTEQGNFAAASAAYQEVLRLNPHDAHGWYGLSRCRKHSDIDRDTLVRIEAALAAQSSPRERSLLQFALGKFLDDCSRFDDAFTHYQQANELVRPKFDRAFETALMDRIKSTCTPTLFQHFSAGTTDSERLVFIVGMLRSGTTLVEQIIASHPQAYACGEEREIHELSLALPSMLGAEHPFPECLHQFEPGKLRNWTAGYLARRAAECSGAERIVVKTPANFLYLGLIALLFPRARIIHCRRDPLDTCLSCYFQNFADTPPWSYDLGDVGFYYRHYEQMMAHWRQALPLRMIEVPYEDLVQRPSEVSRQLVDFCGLPWDDRCLRFHETQRVVRTASKWQVRQPLFNTSIGRAGHYARHLDPLRRALAGER